MKAHVLLFIHILFLTTTTAQIINFPDANFKAKLLQASVTNAIASIQTPDANGSVTSYNTIDANGDGEIQVSEAATIKYLNLNMSGISDLDGINNFTNLLYLNSNNNQLTSIDLSGLINLQFLNCGNNDLTSLDVSTLVNLTQLICNTNQIPNLNVNGLTNLQFLNCGINQLQNIDVSGLANLRYFNCVSNQFTSLNVSNLINLQTLYCANNSISSLDLSGLNTMQQLACADNQMTSLNVSGLTNLVVLNCFNNQLSSLNLNGMINLSFLNSSVNPLSSLNLSGLTNLLQLYCNNNQLSSLDVSTLTNLQQLYCMNNQLPNLNVSDLANLQKIYCENNVLTSIDVSGLTNLQVLQCSDNQLESLFIKNNNASWISLLFENNPNLEYICADDQDISLVQQKINQYGYAATCTVNSYCSFTPGGIFYTIQGNNKYDGNSNGCDASDAFYPNLKFSITDGIVTGNLISNSSGNYSIPVFAGTHTLTPELENPTYFTIDPANTTISFPTSTNPYVQDFCITPNGVYHDLEVVVIPIGTARPGFDATYKIKYKNKGTVTETATLVFNFNEDVLDFVSSTVIPTIVNPGSLSWTIGTIAPFQSGEFVVTLNVNSPMETPAVNAGDLLSYTATLNGVNTDETPEDNTFTLRQTVVNSFDPNDKMCLEGSTINSTMIGEYVHYQIRFENTGTFPAQNIVVKDLIDTSMFDVSTLQMTDTSHSCVTRITNPNQVEFIFENINLPFDDANNDGYLVFKIKTKSTLVTGNTISNLANIYFDYNFPITTNTATSTFQTLQNESFELDAYLTMYPNPVAEILNLKPKQPTEIYNVVIYNLLGQQVQTVINPNESVDVSRLTRGSYIVKITTDKGVFSSKFIKE